MRLMIGVRLERVGAASNTAVWPARRGRDGCGRPSFVLQSPRMSRTLQVMHEKADFSGDVCIDRSLAASDV